MPIQNPLVLGVLALGLVGLVFSQAQAQQPPKLPEPVELGLKTKDGVDITATYYASLAGQQAVPVLMLHGIGGSRADFHQAALELQKDKFAVLVPDLRGHGNSTRRGTQTLDLAKFTPKDYEAIGLDIDACKNFLVGENNKEALNIDALSIVAAETSCILAINYAAFDWSWPRLPTGKQGQDVKALVLLSPEWKFKTMEVIKALNHPALQSEVAVYVLVGDRNAGSLSDAKRIMDQLERGRRNQDTKNAVMLQVNTTLQGTKMLNLPNLNLNADHVRKFVDIYARQKNFPYKYRGNPITGD